MGKKTDNSNLAAKLALRRHFLDRYHAEGAFTVFEACQGSGTLWATLAREYTFAAWGVDLKKAPGRLQVDSIRVLGITGLDADVIDVDTYGSPWKHWFALLPCIDRPVTVFLTEGLVRIGGGNLDMLLRESMGLVFPSLEPV